MPVTRVPAHVPTDAGHFTRKTMAIPLPGTVPGNVLTI